MKKLFQYAVLFHKHEIIDSKNVYKETILLIEPKTILAKDEKEVAFKATREIPEEYASASENIEIIVRPF